MELYMVVVQRLTLKKWIKFDVKCSVFTTKKGSVQAQHLRQLIYRCETENAQRLVFSGPSARPNTNNSVM